MYKDIISYELSENVTQKDLLLIAQQIVTDWMKKQPGFIKWEIHINNDGSYTDIVHWTSKEDAANAEREMVNIPNATDWFACYKEGSISSKKLQEVAVY